MPEADGLRDEVVERRRKCEFDRHESDSSRERFTAPLQGGALAAPAGSLGALPYSFGGRKSDDGGASRGHFASYGVQKTPRASVFPPSPGTASFPGPGSAAIKRPVPSSSSHHAPALPLAASRTTCGSRGRAWRHPAFVKFEEISALRRGPHQPHLEHRRERERDLLPRETCRSSQREVGLLALDRCA